MIISTALTCKNPRVWRSWLRTHHHTAREIWLVFYKKHTGIAGISYEEAVQEALCFGWIDGIVKKLDEERYAQRFTPRRAGSSWSASNIRRMRRLIDEGRMTGVGLRVFDTSLFDVPLPVNPGRSDVDIPDWITSAIHHNRKAANNLLGLAPSKQRLYIAWILDGKKESTQRRRLAEVINRLENNIPMGLK